MAESRWSYDIIRKNSVSHPAFSMSASFSESISSFGGKDGCQQRWITTYPLKTPLEWGFSLVIPAKVLGKAAIGLPWATCPTLCQSLWPEGWSILIGQACSYVHLWSWCGVCLAWATRSKSRGGMVSQKKTGKWPLCRQKSQISLVMHLLEHLPHYLQELYLFF